MKITLINHIDDFRDLKNSWNNLLIQSGMNHIQLTHEYQFTWFKHYGTEGRLFIILIEDNGELIGIAPFIILRAGKFYKNLIKFDRLSFIGTNFSDTGDIIISRNHKEVLASIFEYVFSKTDQWDEISLKQISSGSPNYSFFSNEVNFPNHKVNLREIIGVPYLRIMGDFESYFDQRPKLFKKQIRRYTRKLDQLGNLKFEVTGDINPSLLSEIVELNRNRNELTDRRSIFLSEQKYAFIKDVISALIPKNRIKLFYLKLDDTLLCYDLTFDYANTIYDWNTSFNLEFEKFSPGRLLNKLIIEYCFKNSYSKYDLMAGDEDYKFKWTDTQYKNYDLLISKKDLKSSLLNKYADLRTVVRSKLNV